ncbi:unnamed protein product, partial [marine sediment metagenome]
MKSELLNYSSILSFNREVFLLNYHQEFHAFEDSNKRLQKIAEVVSKRRSDQNESLVGLIPFLLIIARQATNVFECLSRYQSYQTWIVFRPALEAALIIGKFLDNPANAKLWKNRQQIWENKKKDKVRYKKYKKEFEGNGLIPKSMPHGKEFRQLLSRINTEFVHVNYNYFERSYTIEGIDPQNVFLKTFFVDTDPQEHEACLFSFLHMYRLLGSSLGQVLASKYSKQVALNIEIDSM